TGERDRGQEQQRADPQRQAREKAYQERRFDTWANGKRADLQSHQLDRDGEMNRRHSVQRENLAHHLRATYGPDRDRTAANLAATEARLERGGFFYRLFGQAARDRDQADAERRTLASIDMRTGEYEGRLEAQQAEERRQQAERERRERQDLEERITKARDRRERDGWSDAWEAERQAGADRANDNSFGGGPQRGRDRSLGPEM
ncbi:MAG: hypothetical protein SV201_09620, partial [Pseudomonadota bacterium]|nr:hypothetical protein [Pseudomonadota bacterium]